MLMNDQRSIIDEDDLEQLPPDAAILDDGGRPALKSEGGAGPG